VPSHSRRILRRKLELILIADSLRRVIVLVPSLLVLLGEICYWYLVEWHLAGGLVLQVRILRQYDSLSIMDIAASSEVELSMSLIGDACAGILANKYEILIARR